MLRRQGGPHQRLRRYHSNAVRYGFGQQALDCDFCMAVRAGDQVILRGQTGTDLNEVMHGAGDAVAQAEQAMDNVAVLLGEAGAGLADVVKATVFVTDRAFLAGVTDAVLRRLDGVDALLQRAGREGPRQPGTADGGRHHRGGVILSAAPRSPATAA